MNERSSLSAIHASPPPTDAWACPKCALSLVHGGDSLTCDECGYAIANHGGIWSANPRFVPLGFTERNRAHLGELESSHFWFEGRARLFASILRRNIHRPVASLLELGCGSGQLLPLLGEFSADVTGVDGHFFSLERARKGNPRVRLIHADVARLPLTDAMCDVVCAFDVLEHVESHPFLRETKRVLRPDGLLVASVPAFPSLWSSVDERAHHRCRYRLAQTRGELEAAGFRLRGYTHYQFLLFPLIWLSRRFAGGKGRNRVESRPGPMLSRLLGGLNRLEVRTLSGWALPAGSSLVVWAEPTR